MAVPRRGKIFVLWIFGECNGTRHVPNSSVPIVILSVVLAVVSAIISAGAGSLDCSFDRHGC
ncbi:MAG: hypothetical protein EAZ61_01435 [Oscillatoriales cyanobacterium]|nr:MAG: hypothetical protein EAZ61_01435 [Oscillatoriales cyanobacterium]